MAEQITVTPAQVAAAQMQVDLAEKLGETVSSLVRRIARAEVSARTPDPASQQPVPTPVALLHRETEQPFEYDAATKKAFSSPTKKAFSSPYSKVERVALLVKDGFVIVYDSQNEPDAEVDEMKLTSDPSVSKATLRE